MESKDLKEQFLLLQAQQQQKLLERRKRKEEANKNIAENKKDLSGSLGVNDDLGLKTADPTDSVGSYISEELVDHLNNQIRQMKDENGRLYKLVSERDFEIRQLKKKIEDNNSFISAGGGVTNETAATKIIELSKKVRELTSEKEVEKTKCKQFQKKLQDLQLQMQSLPPSSEVSAHMGSVVSLQASSKDDDGVDIKALQDRLKQSESRATDLRNQCQSQRQELKIAHKVLSQEIGEHVNFQTLLNETSNWRGRAQQIISLQQKVDELKGQLDGPPSDGSTNNSEKTSSIRRRQEEKYREDLRRMEKERKESQENAAVKLTNLEAENVSIKDKLEAAKTRNKVLSNEIKSLKAQVQTLLRKSRNDDEFIDALMKQQTQMKQLLEDHNQHQTQQQHLQQQQLQQMSVKSQQDSNVVEQLKTIAAQKESQVKILEMELRHMKMVHQQNQSSNGYSPQQVFTTSTSNIVTSNDSRPTTASVNDILTSSDLIHSTLSSARSRSASRMSRPASVSDDPVSMQTLQQELTVLRYQYKEMEVLSLAAQVEKDKMKELVQVLQSRLSEETQRLTGAQADLQAQKRQTVELEKKLARHILEANKKRVGSKVLNSAREEGADDVSGSSHGDRKELIARNGVLLYQVLLADAWRENVLIFNWEEVDLEATWLEIQKDENESLKVALQQTLRAKEEDLKVYSTTLEETKTVFLQALRQMKTKQSIS